MFINFIYAITWIAIVCEPQSAKKYITKAFPKNE